MKHLYIAEKPSVAQEFAKALKSDFRRVNGFLESKDAVVTWCVGHLVTMSYPEVYDASLKRWSFDTLPFIPAEFKYEIIENVKSQFNIVSSLLNREDVDCIYVCTDSGREGEYIYRLVEQMAGVKGKQRKRVWIDSQTEEEILKGIREAKDLSEYDNLAAAAYLRAKEDYLMGINFSRVLTLKYGNTLSDFLKSDRTVLSVGRVMTCVLGMVVRREREIRDFVKTPFYRILAELQPSEEHASVTLEAEWKVSEGSPHYGKSYLYKDNGFKEESIARAEAERLKDPENPKNAGLGSGMVLAVLTKINKKQEKKFAPLLFNLAELQNVCSKVLKISPDETLKIVQELYEKKLVTYPRTDARVLSSAIAKEIHKNIAGLKAIPGVKGFAEEIMEKGLYKGIEKTRYTNDKQITDHYAIIPTGQGIGGLSRLPERQVRVYEMIVRRFLSIFFPPALYKKYQLECDISGEKFSAGFRTLIEEGYQKVLGRSYDKKKKEENGEDTEDQEVGGTPDLLKILDGLKKGDRLPAADIFVKEGETSPPKRYTSGSMILAMENAGQLIEDEDLRAQIKGSGIGTSATRAEILKKLVTIKYLNLAGKTQVITPTLLGELVFDTVDCSIRPLLNPELTASWELGLTRVAEGSITSDEYMDKLDGFIRRRTAAVMQRDNRQYLRQSFGSSSVFYPVVKDSGKTDASEAGTKKKRTAAKK